MFDIKENLKKLPDAPGVYLHKDKLGQVIYVGKAISLKKRVSQYFGSQSRHSAKVRAMVENIEEFEYILVGSEVEALVLECNLIKKYEPKYNVLLRDDKSYPYIELTLGEKFPRLLKTRRTDRKKSRYFGPYPDAGAVNQIVELLNDIYILKRCNMRSFPKNFRPCLNYHIGKCKAMCVGKVEPKEYREVLDEVSEFLNGKTDSLVKRLKKDMEEASLNLDFEKAAKIRDQLIAIESISETQRASIVGIKDVDIVIGIKTVAKCYAVLFQVRQGKLLQRDYFSMYGALDKKEAVSEFIKQYYADSINLPYQILIEEDFEEQRALEKFLGERAGRKLEIYVPKRGSKKELLKLAKNDSEELENSIDLKEKNKKEREETVRRQLNQIIEKMGLGGFDKLGENYRVEAYDISNTNGLDSVGGMVVFEELRPNRKSYRRFKLRTVEGPDDYAAMAEVLARRLRAAEEGESAFLPLPDLILLDGGKGQVSAGLQALAAAGVAIPLLGMAKDEHHRTRALVLCIKSDDEYDRFFEVELKDYPILFKYIGMIQEEVHRFSIDYHKKLRDKKVVSSLLDEISGIGPTRRTALLSHFGSIDAIKKAKLSDLAAAPSMNMAAAEAVFSYFREKTAEKR